MPNSKSLEHSQQQKSIIGTLQPRRNHLKKNSHNQMMTCGRVNMEDRVMMLFRKG